MPIAKKCYYCGEELKGRSDKKFCNDNCRNAHNNSLRNRSEPLVKHTNAVLLRNRHILQALVPAGKDVAKITRRRLEQLGFDFRYITSIYRTQTDRTYFFCYDFGYLSLEKGWFLVVKRKPE